MSELQHLDDPRGLKQATLKHSVLGITSKYTFTKVGHVFALTLPRGPLDNAFPQVIEILA